MTVTCKNKCGFADKHHPTEFGLDFYDAVGTCPNCEAPMVDENGNETKFIVMFTPSKGQTPSETKNEQPNCKSAA